MQHLHKMEDSLFLELINTPFSKIKFTSEELEALREMEAIIENRTVANDPKNLSEI
jgi:hypothetical protein